MRKARLLARCCRSSRCRPSFRCRITALSALLLAAILLPLAGKAQTQQSKGLVKFQLRDKYLIVVQAMVNGTGPFRFLLDTGSTHTVISPDLARRLQAPIIGEAALTTVSDMHKDRLARLREIRVGEATVSELGAVVDRMDQVKLNAPGVQGVLGEDFLSQFDFLIDYKKRELHFDAAAPAGERCRIESIGQYHGQPTTNRLLIQVEFLELNRGKVQLQLDTGARVPELFPVRPDAFPSQPWAGSLAFTGGTNGTTVHPHTALRIGTTLVSDVDVVQSRRGVVFDAVGLLPASLFNRIYISHTGGFVVLNPAE